MAHRVLTLLDNIYTIDSVLVLTNTFNMAHGYGIPQRIWAHPKQGKTYKKHTFRVLSRLSD
jgi:hypothetical protein